MFQYDVTEKHKFPCLGSEVEGRILLVIEMVFWEIDTPLKEYRYLEAAEDRCNTDEGRYGRIVKRNNTCLARMS